VLVQKLAGLVVLETPGETVTSSRIMNTLTG
jgi:hypothetical protein